MLIISAMIIIKQSLDFVLTAVARSKKYVFTTSCQGRLVLSAVIRSEIVVSDNIDLQVLLIARSEIPRAKQTSATGYFQRFSTSTYASFL